VLTKTGPRHSQKNSFWLKKTEILTSHNFGLTYQIEMATFSLESSVNALQDTPILPNFQDHPTVQAKLLDFSSFKDMNKDELVSALQNIITAEDMVVIAASDSPQPVPIHQMTVESLCLALTTKKGSEVSALVSDESLNAFNNIKSRIDRDDEHSAEAVVDLQKLAFSVTLEAVVTRVVKKSALYHNPFTQRPILLLGNRGLYFTDKAKINAAEARARKASLRASKAAAKGNPKDDFVDQPSQDIRKRHVSDDELSAEEDLSCHGGDGSSPYSSEWEHSAEDSDETVMTQPSKAHQQGPTVPAPFTLTQSSLAAHDGAFTNLHRGISLTPNAILPLSLGTPAVLGAPMASANDPTLARQKTDKASKKLKSKKSAKKKSKKTKSSKRKARSPSKSRSRSRSPSSSKSIEIPPPRPSADQVFCVSIYFIVSYVPS